MVKLRGRFGRTNGRRAAAPDGPVAAVPNESVMQELLKGITGFLPVGYAVVTCIYVSLLFGEEPAWRARAATRGLTALVLLHLAALLLRGFVLSHCPLATGFELVSFLGLAIAATHLVVERVTGYRSPGIPAVGLALALQTAASTYLRYDVAVPEAMRFWVVPLHATLGMSGHAGFFVAATYAILYLALYRLIKRRRLDRVWQSLPPLETMHRMSFWAAGIGLAFLSLAVATGLGRAVSIGIAPKPLFSSVVSWIAFGGLLLMARLRRLGGRRFALATLIAAAIDLGALFLTEALHGSHLEG